MADVRVPHLVIYEVAEASPITSVIESLRATEQLFFETAPLLEDLVPGVTVGGIRVHVESLTQGSPLKELFFATMFVAFQKDLERDVPQIVERLTGIHIPDHYDSVVTLLFCLVLFYGADFIYKQIAKVAEGSKIRAQLDGLVREVAAQCRVEEDIIREKLEARFQKKRLANLIQTTVDFFSPSKRQGNAPVLIGSRRFDTDTVSEFPGEAQIREFEEEESNNYYERVGIELHAQDVDRSRVGWAGVIPSLSDRRLRMQVYPPIKPEEIYTREKITGDVIVLSRRAPDGSMEPYMFHLIRVWDD
jgi:hypothetical protein